MTFQDKIQEKKQPQQIACFLNGIFTNAIKKREDAIHKTPEQVYEELVGLPQSHRDALCILLGFMNHDLPIYPSQEYIAKKIGRQLRTVNRIVATLHHLGLITEKKQRGINRSCVYKLSAIFKDCVYRNKLKSLLPSIKALFVGLLLSLQMPALEANGVLSIKELFGIDYYLLKRDGLAMQSGLMPEWVKNLRSLRLAKKGECLIAGYNAEVVKSADEALLHYKKPINDRFALFKRFCDHYAALEGISYSENLSRLLYKHFDCKEQEPYLLEETMNKPMTLHTTQPRQESLKRELHSQHPVDYASGEAVHNVDEDKEPSIYGQLVAKPPKYNEEKIVNSKNYVNWRRNGGSPAVAVPRGKTHTSDEMIAKVGELTESKEWQELRNRWGADFMNQHCCFMVKVAIDESRIAD